MPSINTSEASGLPNIGISKCLKPLSFFKTVRKNITVSCVPTSVAKSIRKTIYLEKCLMMESLRDDDDDGISTNYDYSQENPSELDESLSEAPVSNNNTLTVLCILFVTLFERLAFYGVAANLVLYCEDVLKLSSPLSSIIALAFQGMNTVYVLSLVWNILWPAAIPLFKDTKRVAINAINVTRDTDNVNQ